MSSVGFCRVFILAVLTLSGCATSPPITTPPSVEREDSSGIGMAVELRLPLSSSNYSADQLFFIRLDESSTDLSNQVITSNFAKDGRVYLLNVPPGQYAVVAASFKSSDVFIAYFPQSLIDQTRIIVGKREISIGGRFVVDMSLNICPNEADESQIHYAEILDPGSPKCGFFKQMLHAILTNGQYIAGNVYLRGGLTRNYRGSLLEVIRNDTEQLKLQERAKEDLAGTGWPALIK